MILNIGLTKPENPDVGQIFYDRPTGKINIYNGQDWYESPMGSTYKPAEKFIIYSDNMAIISDYSFYTINQEDIESWAKENCAEFRREGMVLFFPTAEDRTMFLIRWAS